MMVEFFHCCLTPKSDVIFPRWTIHVHYKITIIDTDEITLQYPEGIVKKKIQKSVKKSELSQNQPESDVIFPWWTIHVHYKMTNIDNNEITLQCLEGIVKKKTQEIVKEMNA
jgi:hypothetical protein